MKEFLANLGSLAWWVSVVIVGILINLASAYLKSRLDSSLSRTSTRWRLRSEAQRLQRSKAIAALRENWNEQVLMGISQLRNEIRTVGILLASVACLSFITLLIVVPLNDPIWWPLSQEAVSRIVKVSKFIFLFLGSVAVLVAMSLFFQARYQRRLLQEARRQPDLNHSSNPNRRTGQ